MNFIRQIKSAGLLFGVISLILGLILSFRPVQTEVFLNTIVGICLLVMAVSKLVQYFFLRKDINQVTGSVIVPVLIAILGIFILMNPQVTMFTVGIIIAIFALTLAIDRFMIAYHRKKLGVDYGTTIIFGVVQLIFSIVMFWNSFETMTAIVVMTGIYLVTNGIMIVASSLFLKDLK